MIHGAILLAVVAWQQVATRPKVAILLPRWEVAKVTILEGPPATELPEQAPETALLPVLERIAGARLDLVPRSEVDKAAITAGVSSWKAYSDFRTLDRLRRALSADAVVAPIVIENDWFENETISRVVYDPRTDPYGNDRVDGSVARGEPPRYPRIETRYVPTHRMACYAYVALNGVFRRTKTVSSEIMDPSRRYKTADRNTENVCRSLLNRVADLVKGRNR